MTRPSRIVAIAALVGLATVVAEAAPGFDPFAEVGIDGKPGARVPLDLVFRDEQGREVSLRELAEGKPIVLAPVVHDCPNICGVTLGGLAAAVDAQTYRPEADFEIIAFGIDPNESAEDARASVAGLRRRSPTIDRDGVHAVIGRPANVAAVADALGYRYAWDEAIGQYAHAAAVAVLTPDGRLARWLYGIAPDPTDLHLALTEAGEGRIGTWGDRFLLLCYHYDPKTGRYGTLVWFLLRTGGGVTVLALGGFVVAALRRERRAVDEARR